MVRALHRFCVICHSVERNVIELCMEQPCWYATVAHHHGGQKSARTSGVHFATKAHTFCLCDKVHLYLPSQVDYLELLLLFAYFKLCKMSPIQETISRNVHSLWSIATRCPFLESPEHFSGPKNPLWTCQPLVLESRSFTMFQSSKKQTYFEFLTLNSLKDAL